MKIIKIIHHQLGLEAEIKNNKTFIKWLRKNSIGIRIKLKILIHDKKIKHVEFFDVFFYIKIFININ
jgi:hypothetical protein